jgi:hypothetical protein
MPKGSGGGGGGSGNQKAVAAAAKKAAVQSVKDQKKAAQQELAVQKEWCQGADLRGQARAESAAAKADDAARKRREKAALLAEEEDAATGGGRPKQSGSNTSSQQKGGKKKGKNNNNNDLSMLENALVSGAEKKLKAKKQVEQDKAAKLKAQEETKQQQLEQPLDPLLANTEEMIRGTTDNLVGRAANKALDDDNAAVSGIDGALESLNIGVGGGGSGAAGTGTSGPSAKALFKAFEERTLREMKQEHPGLKLSQYKDKIFQLWKKSPENPANHHL